MDWAQKEQFADFLIGYSKSNQFDFSAKKPCLQSYSNR
jgi:hypothetical protein